MNKQAEAIVLGRFPYKTLSKWCDATNYMELAKVCNKVYKNLTAINSALKHMDIWGWQCQTQRIPTKQELHLQK
eukprot:10490353-Ditylum_brightwellii.AAC.1